MQHLHFLILHVFFVANGQPNDCSIACGNTESCVNDPQYHGSYYKSWLTPSVCFGLYPREDGSTCFQPNDLSCNEDVLKPLRCEYSSLTENPMA